MSLQVITANRLRDGMVVYLAEAGSWTEDLTEAAVASIPDLAEALMDTARTAERNQIVVEPYAIDVARFEDADGQPTLRPVRYREFIRATGPSIRPDLVKPVATGLVADPAQAFQNGV